MTIDYTKPQQQYPAPQNQQPLQPQKNSGCIKWLAIGCVVAVFLGAAGAGGIVFFVFGLIRSSDVYKEALQRARSNPQVIAALGQPIDPGWWVAGSINIENNSGHADITFPIKGPNGGATVEATATKKGDQWTYSRLRVKPKKGPDIDLLSARDGG
jgi:hypothetical protein